MYVAFMIQSHIILSNYRNNDTTAGMNNFQIVRASSNDHLMTSRQIEKDLLRTIPGHICFNSKRATGVPRMRRILRGLAWLYPDIGYCQGTVTKLLC